MRRRQPVDQRRRWHIAGEMPRQLGSKVARRRRVDREIGKHGARLRLAVLRVATPEQAARAGLVPVGLEIERAIGGFDADRAAHEAAQAPAGRRARQVADIALAIMADTQRVEFEDFARQIFVEPRLAPRVAGPRRLRQPRLRPDRLPLVELEQPRRIALHRE